MSILRKLMLTMTAVVALLTVPSAAFASTASPAAVTRAAASSPSSPTGAFTPVGRIAATPPPPPCSLLIFKPRLVGRTVEGKVELQCTARVTNIDITAKLFRNGRLVASRTGHKDGGTTFTITASRACRNHNRGTFTTRGSATVTYRGHRFHNPGGPSPAASLACGF